MISKEYSEEWTIEKEPFYQINDTENQSLYLRYKALAEKEKFVFFGGRLAEYRYMDMDQVIQSALAFSSLDKYATRRLR